MTKVKIPHEHETVQVLLVQILKILERWENARTPNELEMEQMRRYLRSQDIL